MLDQLSLAPTSFIGDGAYDRSAVSELLARRNPDMSVNLVSQQRRKDWHSVRKGACVWVFQRREAAARQTSPSHITK
jgi:hypothetical protein